MKKDSENKTKKVDMTMEFRRSDEYKRLYDAVKSLSPGMNDYLVDLVIWGHLSNPNAFRDVRLHKQAAKYDSSKEKQKPESLVLNNVQVTDSCERACARDSCESRPEESEV